MQAFTRIASMAALSIATLTPVAVHAQAQPAAADIIAKYVTAIGGKTELMKITSIKRLATMEVPAVGISAAMEVYSAAPNKIATKSTIPGVGEMQQGYNGSVGWDVNPMQGPRLLADKELAVMADNADFYSSMLYSADKFTSLETVGDTTIGGEKAYKVKMVPKATGNTSYTYFSAVSGLAIANSGSQESQMGVIQVFSTMSDYKQFGPVKIATKMESNIGPQKIIMTVQDIIINGAPESAFEIPEKVKPLIKP